MNKEAEFLSKGRRKDNNKWIVGCAFKNSNGTYIFTKLKNMEKGECTVYGHEVFPKSVCKCTGVCLNDILICEYDVLYSKSLNKTGIVKWNEEKAKFFICLDDAEYDFNVLNLHYWEVIGNICDKTENECLQSRFVNKK